MPRRASAAFLEEISDAQEAARQKLRKQIKDAASDDADGHADAYEELLDYQRTVVASTAR